MAGPHEGKLGDWSAWKASEILRKVHADSDLDQLYVYGDPTYTLSYGVMGGYKAQPPSPLNPVLQAVNAVIPSIQCLTWVWED